MWIRHKKSNPMLLPGPRGQFALSDSECQTLVFGKSFPSMDRLKAQELNRLKTYSRESLMMMRGKEIELGWLPSLCWKSWAEGHVKCEKEL